MVRVKIQLGTSDNADKFVWRYSETERYSNLIEFVTSTFSNICDETSFQIQYKDDEGDLITCSSDSDINDALHFAQQENLRSLKLFIVTNENDNDVDDVHHPDIDNSDDDDVDSDNGDSDDGDSKDSCLDDKNAEEEEDEDEEEEEEDEDDYDEEVEVKEIKEYGGDGQEYEYDDGDEEHQLQASPQPSPSPQQSPQPLPQPSPSPSPQPSPSPEQVQQVDVEVDVGVEVEPEPEPEEEPEEEEEEEEEYRVEEEKEDIATVSELLEFAYTELVCSEAKSVDFVVTICKMWPMNAAYPIHLGAMIEMVIADKTKQHLYGSIITHKYYHILQKELRQYSGSLLQPDIKQMANLCNTVGSDKFCCLSTNILHSFKKLLNGNKFALDFAPLLQQTAKQTTFDTHSPSHTSQSSQSQCQSPASSLSSKSKRKPPKPKAKAKQKQKPKANPKQRQKAKIKIKSKPKVKPTVKPLGKAKVNGKGKEKREKKGKKVTKPIRKRILYSHGAYISCSECDACPIRGARYVCMIRENYNICQECEDKLENDNKVQYPMIKIYKPRPNWHIKNFKGLQELVAIPQQPAPPPPPQPQPQPEQKEKQQEAATINSVNSVHSTNSITVGANFPFMSAEMQEKYIENNNYHNNNQTHSAPIDHLAEIPIASIMPSMTKPQKSNKVNNNNNSALKKNESLMAEIDALLTPSTPNKANANTNSMAAMLGLNIANKQEAHNRNNIITSRQTGLDRLAFANIHNRNKNNNNNINNNINNNSMSKSDLSGLIDLVNQDKNNSVRANTNTNNNNNTNTNNNNANNSNMENEYDAFVVNTQHPGDIATNASATMTWSIKNSGYKAFGENCKLAFVSGDGLLVSQYHIPNATPSQIVKVSMSFNAFSTPGTYETNFRLCCNGKQFGPQLIVKINVVDPSIQRIQRIQPPPQLQAQQAQQPQQPPQPPSYWGPQQQQQPQPQPQPQPRPLPRPQAYYPPQQPKYYPQQTVHGPPPVQSQPQPHHQPMPPHIEPQRELQSQSQPQPQSQSQPQLKPLAKSRAKTKTKDASYNEPTTLFPSNKMDKMDDSEKDKDKKGWFGWGKKKENTKKESNLSCLCGATLIYLDVKQAYKGKKVYCDICSKVCKQCIFHCPSGDIKAHPGGFDLCYQCGGSQVAKQPNPSPTEMLLTTDSGMYSDRDAVAAVAAMSYPALKPSAPPAPSPNKGKGKGKSKKDNNYDENFVYPSQLKQLLDMGFDKDKSRRLLLKNRGNMSQVLAQLIK